MGLFEKELLQPGRLKKFCFKNYHEEPLFLVAKALQKPENYCVVTLVPDQRMAFGGTEEPCAIANLMSIGKLGKKENIAHSKALFEKITAELGISPSRMYITFQDEPSSNVGYQGTTFYEIFGG
ncbi:unnamed protein product [Allacma fusca]|uniref:Macrophage migration inhibitory factor n=1 Tax=Allacma fusca TaxID=39272 RepID=A0A8J2L4I4_9HEXA|nr:unnamed protein product [Allacma fusca]